MGKTTEWQLLTWMCVFHKDGREGMWLTGTRRSVLVLPVPPRLGVEPLWQKHPHGFMFCGEQLHQPLLQVWKESPSPAILIDI